MKKKTDILFLLLGVQTEGTIIDDDDEGAVLVAYGSGQIWRYKDGDEWVAEIEEEDYPPLPPNSILRNK